MVRYLDLDLFVNGTMDTLLLVLTGQLLNIPTRPRAILAGTLIGEIPVILSAYFPSSAAFGLSKYISPFLMVWFICSFRGMRIYLKAVLLFWILSAGLGGFVYALWGWLNFKGLSMESLRIGFKNLWVLPLSAGLWWLGQKAWYRSLAASAQLQPSLYDLNIDFGSSETPIQVTALLDTGNQLKDPLTGVPVILVEQEIAATAIPQEFLPALDAPWRNMEDPWPWLWKTNPDWMSRLVFIPYQAVEHKSWLLGIRPQRIICTSFSEPQEIKATLALVQHNLSPDGMYQALLHPEHVQGAEGDR